MKNIVLFLGLAVLLIAGIYVNYINIVEAYGSGPPYYGQTTNMDKWESPVLFLVLFNGVLVSIAFLIVRFGLKAKS